MRINTRVNKIYYTDITDSLKTITVYQYKKLKIIDAHIYLTTEKIGYNTIQSVVLEEITLDIPNEEVNNYII